MADSLSQFSIPGSPGLEVKRVERMRPSIGMRLPIWLVALAALVTGLITILDGLLTRFPERPVIDAFLPFDVYHWSRLLTLAVGALFIYVSFNLLQRRRVAWWVTVIGSLVMIALLFGRPEFWYVRLAPIVTLTLLLLFRRRFSVRSESRSITRGLTVLGIALAVAIAYGTLGFWTLDQRDFGVTFSVNDAVTRTFREFVLIGNGDLVAQTRHARWFLGSLDIVGLSAGGFAAYSLFRPVAYRFAVLPKEREAARSILGQYGRSSYDFFKVWSDKSYLFSSTRKSFISYKTVSGVAFALGDPIGPDTELTELTESFLQFCSDNGWLVCFLMAERIPMYRRLGFSVLKIGEDAIVDLERFSAETSQQKYFRHIKRKFTQGGYSTIRYRPPHPPEVLDEVAAVSDEWLTMPGHREFGFLQGRFERNYVSETTLFVVRDPNGRAVAFVNEAPSFREGETTFDMMRHRAGTHGVMDYLFLELMLTLKQEGFSTFNMGTAPLAGVGVGPNTSVLEKGVHLLYEHLNLVSTKGLREYKLKFEPQWEDRFMVYKGGPLGLIRIATFVTRVF